MSESVWVIEQKSAGKWKKALNHCKPFYATRAGAIHRLNRFHKGDSAFRITEYRSVRDTPTQHKRRP